MFTGIIEAVGSITALVEENENLHLHIRAPFTHELQVDQSVAHNGVCLTVVAIDGEVYQVTVIKESLDKTNIGKLKVDQKVNLERSLTLSSRLDGHMVQGHVDQTATVDSVEDQGGSWFFWFSYEAVTPGLVVNKGSICVNGVSLTVAATAPGKFAVAIIPYTFEHTNFHALQAGDAVNLEFDILGKYVARFMQAREEQQ